MPRLLALAALALAAVPTYAQITIVAPTATTAGSFTIVRPITIPVTSASSIAQVFVLQSLVATSDGTRTFSDITPSQLSFRVNGASTTPGGTSRFADNLNTTVGAFGPTDGYFFSGNSFTVAAGDTVTLDAASYALAAAADFNPQATQTFTGNIFLAGPNGGRLSPNVSLAPVPEPATVGLAAGRGANRAFDRLPALADALELLGEEMRAALRPDMTETDIAAPAERLLTLAA